MKSSEKLETHMQIEKLRELLEISDSMGSLIEIGLFTVNSKSDSVEFLRDQSAFLSSLIERAMFLATATKATAVAAIDLAEKLANEH